MSCFHLSTSMSCVLYLWLFCLFCFSFSLTECLPHRRKTPTPLPPTEPLASMVHGPLPEQKHPDPTTWTPQSYDHSLPEHERIYRALHKPGGDRSYCCCLCGYGRGSFGRSLDSESFDEDPSLHTSSQQTLTDMKPTPQHEQEDTLGPIRPKETSSSTSSTSSSPPSSPSSSPLKKVPSVSDSRIPPFRLRSMQKIFFKPLIRGPQGTTQKDMTVLEEIEQRRRREDMLLLANSTSFFTSQGSEMGREMSEQVYRHLFPTAEYYITLSTENYCDLALCTSTFAACRANTAWMGFAGAIFGDPEKMLASHVKDRCKDLYETDLNQMSEFGRVIERGGEEI